MQLKLTWRISGQRDMNLLVADGQKIKETMEILAERGLIDEETAERVRFVRAMRKNNQVSVLLTYSIYTLLGAPLSQIAVQVRLFAAQRSDLPLHDRSLSFPHPDLSAGGGISDDRDRVVSNAYGSAAKRGGFYRGDENDGDQPGNFLGQQDVGEDGGYAGRDICVPTFPFRPHTPP